MVCNIDGCLTNGHIYVSGDQKEIISYDVKDAIGISLLKKSGIEVCAPQCNNNKCNKCNNNLQDSASESTPALKRFKVHYFHEVFEVLLGVFLENYQHLKDKIGLFLSH